MTEKSEGTAVDKLRGKGAAETGVEAESPERTAAVEVGWGRDADVTVVAEVAINDAGRDTDGFRVGLPLREKLLVNEVKGGRAGNTGVMGAEDPCGSEIEERGFETFREVLKLERPDNAGLRQVAKLMGTDAEVYARPNVPDKLKVL